MQPAHLTLVRDAVGSRPAFNPQMLVRPMLYVLRWTRNCFAEFGMAGCLGIGANDQHLQPTNSRWIESCRTATSKESAASKTCASGPIPSFCALASLLIPASECSRNSTLSDIDSVSTASVRGRVRMSRIQSSQHFFSSQRLARKSRKYSVTALACLATLITTVSAEDKTQPLGPLSETSKQTQPMNATSTDRGAESSNSMTGIQWFNIRKDTASIDTTLVCGLWDPGAILDCTVDSPRFDQVIKQLRDIDRGLTTSVDLTARFRFWEDGRIPYFFAGDWRTSRKQLVREAIARWTQETNLRFIEHSPSQVPPAEYDRARLFGIINIGERFPKMNQNIVFFRFHRSLSGADGRATPGKLSVDIDVDSLFTSEVHRSFIVNGQQGTVGVDLTPDCDFDCIAHELGHLVGLLHEHQRWDRDRFLRIPPEAALFSFGNSGDAKGALLRLHQNFDATAMPLAQSPYDYQSIMNYPQLNYTVPPGIPVLRNDLSIGDIIGAKRLYGFPLPSYTTIETNPPGLNLIVDGRLVDTPHRVSWRRGTNHTLEAPLVQFNGDRSERYLFGNWGGSGRTSSAPTRIHVTADGEASLWYRANFVVQSKDSSSQCDPYCRSWVYSGPEPSYSRTYRGAEAYWQDRIAVWPQAFTFVSTVGSRTRTTVEQRFWITNTTDDTKYYEVINLGHDDMPLRMAVEDSFVRGYRWIEVRGRETKKVRLAIGSIMARHQGSFDAKIGVCEIALDRDGHRTANRERCVDIPVRWIVVPRSAND